MNAPAIPVRRSRVKKLSESRIYNFCQEARFCSLFTLFRAPTGCHQRISKRLNIIDLAGPNGDLPVWHKSGVNVSCYLA